MQGVVSANRVLSEAPPHLHQAPRIISTETQQERIVAAFEWHTDRVRYYLIVFRKAKISMTASSLNSDAGIAGMSHSGSRTSFSPCESLH